jgi:uncharacterized protein YcnI
VLRKVIVLLAITAILAAAGPAIAHVTVQPNEAKSGSFAKFVVRVPNERDDAGTVKVEVKFPDLTFVSFQDVPGWERATTMRKLASPVEGGHGDEPITDTIDTATWSGGRVDPGEFVEFPFSARMPEDASEPLVFPAVQTYDSGEVVNWSGPEDADEPAARVSVVDFGDVGETGRVALLAELAKDGDDGTDLGLIFGIAGAVLGAIALIFALARQRA